MKCVASKERQRREFIFSRQRIPPPRIWFRLLNSPPLPALAPKTPAAAAVAVWGPDEPRAAPPADKNEPLLKRGVGEAGGARAFPLVGVTHDAAAASRLIFFFFLELLGAADVIPKPPLTLPPRECKGFGV
jgi:hypothetical protein